MREPSGREPVTARSAVRMRLVLSLVGVVIWSGAAATVWWTAGLDTGPRLVLAVICAAVAVAAAGSAVVAAVRIRQRHLE